MGLFWCRWDFILGLLFEKQETLSIKLTNNIYIYIYKCHYPISFYFLLYFFSLVVTSNCFQLNQRFVMKFSKNCSCGCNHLISIMLQYYSYSFFFVLSFLYWKNNCNAPCAFNHRKWHMGSIAEGEWWTRSFVVRYCPKFMPNSVINWMIENPNIK